jgi:hypothetical protein
VDQDPAYASGNYWAFSDANHVSVSLGGYQFETRPYSDHGATIQTWAQWQQVAFFGFDFVSPQFANVGSGTQLRVVLQDELFGRPVPTTLPELGQMPSATWRMSLFNGPDEFTVSGILRSGEVTPIPEPRAFAMLATTLWAVVLARVWRRRRTQWAKVCRTNWLHRIPR